VSNIELTIDEMAVGFYARDAQSKCIEKRNPAPVVIMGVDGFGLNISAELWKP